MRRQYLLSLLLASKRANKGENTHFPSLSMFGWYIFVVNLICTQRLSRGDDNGAKGKSTERGFSLWAA